MDRFYCEQSGTEDVELSQPEAHHARNVLRKRVGDPVQLFDGRGHVAEGTLAEVERRRVVVRIEGAWVEDAEPAGRLTLAVAMPKGDRGRFLVEKATELGVARLIPLLTERSVVTPRESRADKLRQTGVAACKQSGRNRLMEIAAPRTWQDFLAETPASWLIGLPGTADVPRPEDAELTFAIGPEGGFTEAEVAAAIGAGAVGCGLGPHVLRIETAALAAAARYAHPSRPLP